MIRLYHAERLEGVCSQVRDFFDWWSHHGPFPLAVVSGVRAPGAPTREELRRLGLPAFAPGGQPWRDIQAALFAAKRTKAATLAETAHGRCGAADAVPLRLTATGCPFGTYDCQRDGVSAVERFERFGELAEANGLAWGGRWKSVFPPFGDVAHVELPRWQSLPYPPVAQEALASV